MSLSERIKLILKENKLKQKDFAHEIGVTESYISAIVNGRNANLSQPLASLIEEKYGYSSEWVLAGSEPKLKQVSKNKSLTEFHQKALMKLEKMNDAEIKAVLAFINSLEQIEKAFAKTEDTH